MNTYHSIFRVCNPGSRKNYILPVATLSVLLFSCTKSKIADPPTDRIQQTLIMDIPDNEAATLAADVNRFAFYTDDYLANPSAPVPQGLAPVYSGENAVQLLENTYNFLYSERTDDLYSTAVEQTQVVVPKDVSGNIAVSDLAAAYNSSFNTLRTAFNAINDNDRKLTLVDVELLSEDNVSATLSFSGYFAWNITATPAALTGSGGVFPTVPSGDYWHWINRLGKYGTTFYDGKMGAPEIISQYVRAYKGYFSPTAAVRFMKPVNIKAAATIHEFTLWLTPSRLMSGYLASGAPPTPDFGRHGVGSGRCLYTGYQYYSSPDPYHHYLTGNAVNYHITQCPTLLNRAETLLGKSVWCFEIKSILSLSLSDKADHEILVTCADRVSSVIVSSTLPYQSTPAARPFKL